MLIYKDGTYLVEKTDGHVHVCFSSPRLTLSSAVLNGGVCRASHLVNMKVDQNFNGVRTECGPPEEALLDYIRRNGWQGTAVGMMTSTFMASFRMTLSNEQDIHTAVICTSGLANAKRAGDSAEYRFMAQEEDYAPAAGTINLIAITDAKLSPSAMTEAVMIITEAKTAAMQELDVKSYSSGKIATGTGTDSIAVITGEGRNVKYCGKHVIFGEMLAKMIISTIRDSVLKNGSDSNFQEFRIN
ncbi:MAG: hypothetical protein A2017_08410 [Lentisphaerae bacterium GWF2_44_16]|nr:MAG: hypothetical protein A2017_08410 [Lentisphaerae bacterium GWF2_44_16]